MATNSKSVRSLDLLDKDIHRLQNRAKQLENEIDNNFTYLQNHSAALFINSLFPRKAHAEDAVREGLLGALYQNERLMNTFNRLANRLVTRATDFINKLIDKWID